jgi:CRP-like cAMP-binding protein
MKEEILKFVMQFPSLTEEEARAIAGDLNVQSYRRGTILLKEGEINKECYFVLKGCVRQYYLVDGEDKTTAFFTENQTAGSSISYIEQTASNHYLSCVEDSMLIIGDPHREKMMFEKYPALESITRVMIEQNLGKTSENFDFFITSSPEERYLNLLDKRPELLQRVAQHQIASYLGMTPESLSRIRKRISRKTSPPTMKNS